MIGAGGDFECAQMPLDEQEETTVAPVTVRGRT
jgi:hypothetical protein